jgi:hypothetical protein
LYVAEYVVNAFSLATVQCILDKSWGSEPSAYLNMHYRFGFNEVCDVCIIIDPSALVSQPGSIAGTP